MYFSLDKLCIFVRVKYISSKPWNVSIAEILSLWYLLAMILCFIFCICDLLEVSQSYGSFKDQSLCCLYFFTHSQVWFNTWGFIFRNTISLFLHCASIIKYMKAATLSFSFKYRSFTPSGTAIIDVVHPYTAHPCILVFNVTNYCSWLYYLLHGDWFWFV